MDQNQKNMIGIVDEVVEQINFIGERLPVNMKSLMKMTHALLSSMEEDILYLRGMKNLIIEEAERCESEDLWLEYLSLENYIPKIDTWMEEAWIDFVKAENELALERLRVA